ncbi:MAG: glycerophosphodiester phosphodiesterase family protein [Solirubrobacterales bacterium]
MLNRITIATVFALLIGLFAVGTATAASPSDRDPIPPPTDYWKDKGFILMAHQGGEWDFPPNTLFAYKKAMALGADMIDMDAYVTKDGKIVLTHDIDIYKNTESPQEDGLKINDLTLAQLKSYDFAYDWSPHDGSSTTPYRGIATGDVTPPPGFTANDFKIPSFDEVLAAFPDTPINIELKAVTGVNETDTATEMAAILKSHPGHDENVIINSFGQSMLEEMHAARPEHLSFGGSLDGTVDYISGQPIVPTPVAVEPPDQLRVVDKPGTVDDVWLDTVPVLKPWTDHDGYKIFVWGSDHDPTQDTDPFYTKLIAQGADSYNTPSPTTLAKYLCENGIARPDGSPRCDQQICPEGQTGIAPDNCVDIPQCLPPETGTPPNCVEVAPKATLKKLSFVKVKGKTKAGQNRKVALKLTATKGRAINVKVNLKSSNPQVKVQKATTVKLKPGETLKKVLTIRSTGKAKGRAKLTATSGKLIATTTLLYKAKKSKTGSTR